MKIKEALDELRTGRDLLEADLKGAIGALIDRFLKDTGLYVKGILVDFTEIQGLNDGHREHHLEEVSVDIELRE